MTAVAGSANRLTHVELSLHRAHQQALANIQHGEGPSSCHFLG